MKPSLQLNLSQQLTLTPQLQQAIRLLQLSTVDLQQEIQQAIETNPMLEEDTQEDPNEESLNSDDENIQWSMLQSSTQKTNSYDDLTHNIEQLYCATIHLHDHLHWQLDLTPMSDSDRMIALTLIDATHTNGFLTQSIEEIQQSIASENLFCDIDEIEAVRHLLQHFDPIGCVSVDLSDSLQIQLTQFPERDPYVMLAKLIIKDHIAFLANHHYRQLMKICQINEETLNIVLKLIQKLNPNPGSIIHETRTEYIIPDVFVKKIKDEWRVFLNNDLLPKISINQQYASLIQRADSSSDNQFLRSNLQEAKWFLKSIQSRQETLMKVASAIVDYQKDFLELGEAYMKPLVLNDVAQALNVHESTISRVTTQKFMHTPRGVFELKYFFSSHVNTETGGECSSTAIRAHLKKIISEENPKKPLSDEKLAQLMNQKGIEIARRTITKYREAMHVGSSSERKKI